MFVRYNVKYDAKVCGMWDVTVAWHDRQAIDPELGVAAPRTVVAATQHNTPDVATAIAEALNTPPAEHMNPTHIVAVERDPGTSIDTFVWRRVGWTDEPLVLIGIKEIAMLFRRSKQWATNTTKRRDFPSPFAVLACGPVWDRTAVETYRQQRSGGS